MILYAFPLKIIKKIFEKNSNVIFVDNQGFWIYYENLSKRILVTTTENYNTKEAFDVPKAKKYLNWWMPLWTRWVPNADKYDQIREQLLISINNIFNLLNHYKINCIIFNTSVPHTLDAVIVSIAAHLNKIKQIYLYGLVINGRLLPLLSLGDISTRAPLDIEVSNFKFGEDLSQFLKNKIAKNNPKINLESKFWKKSFILDIVYIFRREVLNFLKKINFSKKQDSSFLVPENVIKFSLIEDLRIINSQRLYIKSLLKSFVSIQKIRELESNKSPLLLIVAHYQPEANTFPEGNKYFSHVDIALAIRNKNYLSEILYKEHYYSTNYIDRFVGVTKVGISRSETYINILKKLGCLFLPMDYHLAINDDSKWYVPITITGTIALERSLAGLHTIYAGSPWYKGLPGTLYIDDLHSLEHIPSKWALCNEKIAKDSKQFLENILNNKTIVNISGIATGKKDYSLVSIENFKHSILKILEKVK
jgi:hypothetical protein